MNKFTVLWIGGASLLLSVGCYARAAWLGRSSLKPLRWIDRLAALVSHLPDDSSKAWPHVTGGVLGCTGFALLIAAVWDSFAVLGYHLTLEISNLFFALLVAFVAFWTLWQTKRIEQNQAVEMFGFKGLIGQITKEIAALMTEVFAHPVAKFPRFRILLITTNPYFGQLSYPGEKSTDDFANSMRTASKRAAANSMRFEILCGSASALASFHEAYFKKNGMTEPDKAQAATSESLEFISELKGATIHQVRRVPKIQFAVIGNVVLEFILDSSEGHTDIQRYKRTHEKVVADRYEAFFEELTQLYKENGRSAETAMAPQPTTEGDRTASDKRMLPTSCSAGAPATEGLSMPKTAAD